MLPIIHHRSAVAQSQIPAQSGVFLATLTNAPKSATILTFIDINAKGLLILMNTRHAQIILTVLRFGSFTAAAKALYITQPTLSQTVKQIETQLGEPIFVRGRTPLELTPAGELYAQAARQIIRIETQLEEAISHMHGKSCGTLRLGFPLRRSCEVFPHVLSEFIRLYPDVRLEITEADAATLTGMLLRHELDVAFLHSSQRLDSLEYRLVASEEIILLAGNQTRLATRIPSGSTISLVEATDERFILAAEPTDCRRYYDEQTAALGISPGVVMVCDNAETAMRACADSQLVTISPYITMLSDYGSIQKLAHYHLIGETYLPPVSAVCLRGQALAPYAETMISLYANRYRAMTSYRP